MDPLAQQTTLDVLPPPEAANLDPGLPSPVDGAAPETDGQQPAPQPDYAAQIAELRAEHDRQIAELSGRLTQTQTWGNSEHQAALSARAMLTALQQQAANARQEAEWNRQMTPPTLSAEEREQILQDPEVLERTLRSYGDYVWRYTHAQLAPQVQAAAAATELLEPIIQRERVRAELDARTLAADQGIEEADFNALLPAARAIFDGMPNQMAAAKLRMQPEMVFHAVTLARTQNGVPLKKSKPAPQLTGGQPTPTPTNNLRNDPLVVDMERSLGITLSKESLAELAASRAARTGKR